MGATTLSIMTSSITTLSIRGLIVTLSIATFSIMTLSIKGLFVTLSINDAQHDNALYSVPLGWVSLC
jgi:hypothetical protein